MAVGRMCAIPDNVLGQLSAQMIANSHPWIQISSMLSKCALARRCVFAVMVNCAAGETTFGKVATWALSMMAYGHMTYVGLIDVYVIKSNHPVLSLPEMQSDLVNFLDLISDLKAYDALSRYTRVLFDEDSIPSLNRRLFPMLCVAAVVIGKRRNSATLLNFRVFDAATERKYEEFMAKVSQMDAEHVHTSYRATARLLEIIHENDFDYVNEAGKRLGEGGESSIVAL